MSWWIILVLCLVGFTDRTSAGDVLAGQHVNIEDFPYQISLRVFNEHVCGGSIISKKHILTAAHCVRVPYHLLTVVTSSSYTSEEGKSYEASKITVHPNFISDGNRCIHDIAVITLNDTIVFDKYQQKIELPKHNFKVGGKANVTGWGFSMQQPLFQPDQLQVVETELISREECQQAVADAKKTKIYDTEVCALHNDEAGVCFGVSGGPLSANGELVGIVSWTDGDDCTIADYPDVYTNVYQYKDFIESIINV